MEKRLIPISTDLSTNINHWAAACCPILYDPKFKYQDPKFIDSLLRLTLCEYIMNTDIFHNGKVRTGLPPAKYPTYFGYWTYLRKFVEITLDIIHHYTSPERLAYLTTKFDEFMLPKYTKEPHTRQLKKSDTHKSVVAQYIKDLIVHYKNDKYDLSVSLAQSVDCADRMMCKLLDKQPME